MFYVLFSVAYVTAGGNQHFRIQSQKTIIFGETKKTIVAMKFAVESKITGIDFRKVYDVFDFKLLSDLSPSFMKPEAIIYEGNKRGDRLSFRLHTPFFTTLWEGKVSEEKYAEDEIYFVDEGDKMPFGMRLWRHKHRIIKTDYGTLIRDEVQFDTKNSLLTFFLLPGIWLQFLYRKPLYDKIIKKRLCMHT